MDNRECCLLFIVHEIALQTFFAYSCQLKSVVFKLVMEVRMELAILLEKRNATNESYFAEICGIKRILYMTNSQHDYNADCDGGDCVCACACDCKD